MKARRLFPMLSVASLEESLRFYRDLLGGEQTYRFPEEGEPAFVTLKFGDSEIGLGALGGTPLHGQAQRPATGHRVELCVYVDDVDAAFQRLQGSGARVVTNPADQPWGERVAYVSDPDGNLVMLTR